MCLKLSFIQETKLVNTANFFFRHKKRIDSQFVEVSYHKNVWDFKKKRLKKNNISMDAGELASQSAHSSPVPKSLQHPVLVSQKMISSILSMNS